MNTAKKKVSAAIIGGGALVALGVLGTTMLPGNDVTIVSDPTTVTSTTMTTAQTVTSTTAPPEPATPKATPQITTTPTSAEPG